MGMYVLLLFVGVSVRAGLVSDPATLKIVWEALKKRIILVILFYYGAPRTLEFRLT